MKESPVTVFGGTGYVGRRLVAALLDHGHRVRLVARRPQRARFDPDRERRLARLRADIVDPSQVERAVANSAAVVNAVSLYEERGGLSFRDVHVTAAGRLAAAARRARVPRFVQLSGIGVDAGSPSAYVRARALGEMAVRDASPEAVMVRPAALFGRNDALLSALARLARLPLTPLFGRGEVRLQPLWVQDLAEALVVLATAPAQPDPVYELGGAGVYRYRELLGRVRDFLGRHGACVPLPFPVWRGMATVLQCLPGPSPLTRDQVWLMETDNVVGQGVATFADLDRAPADVVDRLADCLGRPDR